MQTTHLISVREFCRHHHIEITFVESLADNGLIETTIVEQIRYVEPEQLTRLEKFVRLHQDLSIHVDDLDVVSDLLDRVESLQEQVLHLQNRLFFYEPR
ncbi:chaperone modulator CbpM [Spirosoma sp. BT702]|uniref:Chaperone modulator CbpM n=1 Tax=Spirosoma profusum TaxID=2771354 RepID=A0A926XXQ1_9BACT|nr:chaperone modulator CbpM [Spirosoma profusum]MBD2699708.1 chaperone modulator CbpM [Spirosoma profusum]